MRLIPDKRTFAVDPKYFPTRDVVQAAGTSFCLANSMMGTLNVRVQRNPNTDYLWLATYHNYDAGGTYKNNFWWTFVTSDGERRSEKGVPTNGQYQLGPQGRFPLYDCVVIKLHSRSPRSNIGGIFGVTDLISGTTNAMPGDLVVKYGMATGKTYGTVREWPPDEPQEYNSYIMLIEHTDQLKRPKEGPFAEGGDSGAPIMVVRGPLENTTYWMAGMLVMTATEGKYGLASRIGPIEAQFQVKVVSGIW
ncbi:MAG TPA: hypothetical protein VJ715_02990 [Pyrinomonadaceae bacterium]|nr:hypothetical protein [Pyrinomonadaceae bacterium]